MDFPAVIAKELTSLLLFFHYCKLVLKHYILCVFIDGNTCHTIEKRFPNRTAIYK